MMKRNTFGGGSKTNLNGLRFEQTTDLESLINEIPNLSVTDKKIYNKGVEIGLICSKGDLYSKLLKPSGIDYKTIVSKKLLPDDAIYNYESNTVYIFEKKFQSSSGSVDEKLQTCDFKKKQYQKMLNSMGIRVEYIYILSDWFKKKEYNDVYDYIKSVGCQYFFNEIPLETIGIIR